MISGAAWCSIMLLSLQFAPGGNRLGEPFEVGDGHPRECLALMGGLAVSSIQPQPHAAMLHTPSMASRGDKPRTCDVLLDLVAKFIDEAETVGDTNPRCLSICSNGIAISLKAARLLKEEKYLDSAELWRNKLYEFSKAIETKYSWVDDQIRSADKQIRDIRKKSS
jgi:hypothetical protein